MVKELQDYVRRHRKKGFEHSEISVFLKKHGWHDSYVAGAIDYVKKEENQRFIAGAVWYILLVFIVTIGLVQVGKFTGAATIDEIYCISDISGLGDVQYQTSKKVCCTLMEQSECSYLDKPQILKGPDGRAIYKADLSCIGQKSRLVINEVGYSACRK